MNRIETKRLLRQVVTAAFITIGLGSSWAHATSVEFCLQTATGANNATLSVGDSLNLEIWATFSGSPLPINLLGYSVFLKPSADGIITYDSNTFVSALPADGYSVQSNGTDNTYGSNSLGGAFGVAYFKPSTATISCPAGSLKLGSFTVTATGHGDATYSFTTDGPLRDWRVDYSDAAGLATIYPTAATPDFQITVVPEPAVVSCLLIGMVWLTQTQRRKN